MIEPGYLQQTQMQVTSGMYESFFGLNCSPFENTPNPKFFFASNCHREALATLVYGVEQGKGFMLVTGEVGTGKTLLVRSLKEQLDGRCVIVEIASPWISVRELFREICKGLQLSIDENASELDLQTQLQTQLLSLAEAGQRVVVIIDEAQQLSEHTLEGIRLLSNMESSTSKLIQLILLGQTELTELLGRHSMRPLRQRITLSRDLKSLGSDDVINYIRHRMQVAGGSADVFSAEALGLICQYSRGVPRLVNLICDNSLITAYASGAHTIGAATIHEVVAELPISIASSMAPIASPAPSGFAMPPSATITAEPAPMALAPASPLPASPAAVSGGEAGVAPMRTPPPQWPLLLSGVLTLIVVAGTSFYLARSIYEPAGMAGVTPPMGAVTQSTGAMGSAPMGGSRLNDPGVGAAASRPLNAVGQVLPPSSVQPANTVFEVPSVSVPVSAQTVLPAPEPVGQQAYGASQQARYLPDDERESNLQAARPAQPGSVPVTQSTMPAHSSANLPDTTQPTMIPNPFYATQMQGVEAIVGPGEALSVLARRQYQTWNETIEDIVRSANPQLSSLDSIVVGDTIRLPSVTESGLVVQDQKGLWYVYFAAFHSRRKAQEQVDSFLSLGDPAVLVQGEATDRPFYRVYLGAFNNQIAAEDKAHTLWYRYLPMLN